MEIAASEAEISLARATLGDVRPHVLVRDFFSVTKAEVGTFDAIVGNPPWIRYHAFAGVQRSLAQARSLESGVLMSGLASSWAPYVVHAVSLLKAEGRFAMVLPGELLQVDYAGPVRRFLAERFRSIRLIAFESQLFEDAQVDAVLLLASADGPAGLTFERVRSLADVDAPRTTLRADTRWANDVVAGEAVDLLSELERTGAMIRLGAVGAVDIGVVTGCNDFFVLNESEVRDFGLERSCLQPIVTRSDQLSRGVVNRPDFRRWATAGRKVWLATLDSKSGKTAQRYLAAGVERGVPAGYKCRTRTPWYSVPLKVAPNIFLSYMASDTPRMALNEAGALSTNLIHGLYLRDPSQGRRITRSWANPATALSVELEGRTYGGGVLKVETREAERVLIPAPDRRFRLQPSQTRLLEEAIATRRSARRRARHAVTPPLVLAPVHEIRR